MGLRWLLRVVYRWASPLLRPICHEIFVSPVNNWQKILAFWGEMGSKCKNFVLGTPKRHIFARNNVIWRIDREDRSRGLGCKLKEEPKRNQPSHLMSVFSYWGGAKGGNRIVMKFCVGVGVPDPCKFRWRSVQGFLRERGSNLPLFHWLALSSLKHSGTTVPACDYCTA